MLIRVTLLAALLAASHPAWAQRATPLTQQKYHTHYPPKPAPAPPRAPAR